MEIIVELYENSFGNTVYYNGSDFEEYDEIKGIMRVDTKENVLKDLHGIVYWRSAGEFMNITVSKHISNPDYMLYELRANNPTANGTLIVKGRTMLDVLRKFNNMVYTLEDGDDNDIMKYINKIHHARVYNITGE